MYSPYSTSINPLATDFSWSPLKHASHSCSAKLAKNWMEYQGIHNWQGLLDPLDDILRSEILKYGRFVEATYRSFDFDPCSPAYATSKFPKNSILTRSCIGDTGYKPTKHLRATSWIHRGPTWLSTRSSWIGYVAVCQDKEEISKLGRRDVVIAFRGTATCLEWLENLRATLTCLPDDMAGVGPKGDGDIHIPMVESGFLSLYTSDNDTCPSLRHMVMEEVGRVLQMHGDEVEPLSITITGHSLGAALATLAAYDIKSSFGNAPMVTVISFGGPRVGNQSFRCELEKSGTKILRIVNSDDVITKVPGFVIDKNEANKEALPGWVETALVYAEVGQELRVSSKECPYLCKEGVVTCHDLSTYLHLVNAFVSSNCPFRATAMRVLYKHHRQKLAKFVD